MYTDYEMQTGQRMPAETTMGMTRQDPVLQGSWDTVWERSRAGRHTIVVGSQTLPPAPPDLQVLRVRCDARGTSGGALEAARRAIADRLGDERHTPDPRQTTFTPGLRQRVWGDMPAPALDALLVDACNRLADETTGRAVLAFEGIDLADEATVDTLAQMLQRPGWLRLPLLLTVHGILQGRVVELVSLLHRDEGEAAVMVIEDETPPAAEVAPCDWRTVPADVLRVLRASAVLGTTFDAALVARLLEEPLGLVLEKLQEATDAGVPLVDRGEGQLTWPAPLVTALQQSTLPSLLRFWHARLGELLSGGEPCDPPSRPRGAPRMVARGQRGAQAEDAWDDLSWHAPEADPARLSMSQRHAVPPTQTASAEATRPPVAEGRGQLLGGRPGARHTVPPSPMAGDQTRAATHLQAAGRTQAAVEHYLAAVREAVARGDVRRAYGVAEQALLLLDSLPTSPPQALLRTQVLLEKGRLQWHGALLGAAFTLQEALASLEAAKASLPDDAPPEVVEQLAAVTAGVCYDIGDEAALQRALDALQESSHRLVNTGAIVLAACLLNDQAAVYMRVGDLVRATYLLSQAHERFESHLRHHPHDAMALAELAGTEHVLARLPLHVQVPPGHEEDSYARGLEHAQAAEALYQRLGQQRPLTRVWETMGRLALQRGHLEVAQERLMTALTLQRQLGDVAGLARSTAALAELCMRTAQFDDAVVLLADSIALNVDKGSPIGLAFNRQALGALARAAVQTHGPGAAQLQGALADLEGRLAQAEAVLGRVGVPGGVASEAMTPWQHATRIHPSPLGTADNRELSATRGEDWRHAMLWEARPTVDDADPLRAI
jgi:tetratricopeptide (TPR) repeat protein